MIWDVSLLVEYYKKEKVNKLLMRLTLFGRYKKKRKKEKNNKFFKRICYFSFWKLLWDTRHRKQENCLEWHVA